MEMLIAGSEGNKSLSDYGYRIVAAYYAMRAIDRSFFWKEYAESNWRDRWLSFDNLQKKPGLLEKLSQHKSRDSDLKDCFDRLDSYLKNEGVVLEAFDRLRILLAMAGISKYELEDALMVEEADDLCNCLFAYRLMKRRTWAKRRVIAVNYEGGARWKTSVSLDINIDYLQENATTFKNERRRANKPEEIGFFNIPIIEVNKRDSFIFFDTEDSRGGTIQLLRRVLSAHLEREIMQGAIAEEYWTDLKTPMLRDSSYLCTLLSDWFRLGGVPGFIKNIETKVKDNKERSDLTEDVFQDVIDSYANWLDDDGSPNFMELFWQDTEAALLRMLANGDITNDQKIEIEKSIELYRGNKTFVYLLALFTFKWIAFLRVPNDKSVAETVKYDYEMARNVLKTPIGSEPKSLSGRKHDSGQKLCFPLNMFGQAESEHFTFIAPEGTLFSHYYDKLFPGSRKSLLRQLEYGENEARSKEKAYIPFYLRCRNQKGSQTTSGDGSMGSEHITIKINDPWRVDGNPNRRVPDEKGYPAYQYEFLCRLRPRLGIRAVGYAVFLIFSILLWLMWACDLSSELPVLGTAIGASLAVATALDKESYIRKQMFRIPRYIVNTWAVLDLLGYTLTSVNKWLGGLVVLDNRSVRDILQLGRSITVCFIPSGIFKLVAGIAALSLAFYLTWVIHQWRNATIPQKVVDYFDKVELFVHERNDSVYKPELKRLAYEEHNDETRKRVAAKKELVRLTNIIEELVKKVSYSEELRSTFGISGIHQEVFSKIRF